MAVLLRRRRGYTCKAALINVLTSSRRLVDDDGRDVAQGQPGELLIRGPIVSKGYHNNEAANKIAFVDGWFCTGDIGIFKEGLFYIVDRKKVGLPCRHNGLLMGGD